MSKYELQPATQYSTLRGLWTSPYWDGKTVTRAGEPLYQWACGNTSEEAESLAQTICAALNQAGNTSQESPSNAKLNSAARDLLEYAIGHDKQYQKLNDDGELSDTGLAKWNKLKELIQKAI